MTLNTVVKWAAFPLHIQKGADLYLGLQTNYPD